MLIDGAIYVMSARLGWVNNVIDGVNNDDKLDSTDDWTDSQKYILSTLPNPTAAAFLDPIGFFYFQHLNAFK